MQKINVALARLIWLFDTNELNPTGKSLFPDMMMWLGEKYKFQTFPKSIGDVDEEKKGFQFKLGEFQSSEGAIAVNFAFYNDGIVAETWSSTEHGDAFLEDVLRSAALRYGLAYQPDLIRAKQYISELVVSLDHSLANLNPKIARFCEALNGIFSRHHLPPFEVTGMIFAPDVTATNYKPPGLFLERKTGVPFTANRFWSKAPFTTKDHELALEAFDKMLADDPLDVEIQPIDQIRKINL